MTKLIINGRPCYKDNKVIIDRHSIDNIDKLTSFGDGKYGGDYFFNDYQYAFYDASNNLIYAKDYINKFKSPTQTSQPTQTTRIN